MSSSRPVLSVQEFDGVVSDEAYPARRRKATLANGVTGPNARPRAFLHICGVLTHCCRKRWVGLRRDAIIREDNRVFLGRRSFFFSPLRRTKCSERKLNRLPGGFTYRRLVVHLWWPVVPLFYGPREREGGGEGVL